MKLAHFKAEIGRACHASARCDSQSLRSAHLIIIDHRQCHRGWICESMRDEDNDFDSDSQRSGSGDGGFGCPLRLECIQLVFVPIASWLMLIIMHSIVSITRLRLIGELENRTKKSIFGPIPGTQWATEWICRLSTDQSRSEKQKPNCSFLVLSRNEFVILVRSSLCAVDRVPHTCARADRWNQKRNEFSFGATLMR